MSLSVNVSERDALLAGTSRPYYSGLADMSESGIATDSEVILRTINAPEEPRSNGMPLIRAMFVVANAALGAGMLNFPQAYAQAGGIANALAIQFVSSQFTFYVNLAFRYKQINKVNFLRVLLIYIGNQLILVDEHTVKF